MDGSLIIVSGQSGAGKTSIVEGAIERSGIGKRVITCTSRHPREKEMDGIDYHFLPRALFHELIERSEFAEHAEVYGNLYGTLKRDIASARMKHSLCYIITDVQGAGTLMQVYPHAHSIFITLPEKKDLEERLRKRGDSDASIEKRLQSFYFEQEEGILFDSIIMNKNGDLSNSITEFIAQVQAYHTADITKRSQP